MNIITEKEDWTHALKQVPYYDIYHTYEYHEISKATPEDTPILIEYIDGVHKIYLPLIKRHIPNTSFFDATSVYGYAGPIHVNIDAQFDTSKFSTALTAVLKEENIISVFSRLNPYIQHQESILKALGAVKTLGNIVNIDLSKPIDTQRTLFSKTTKRYINKCRKLFDVKMSSEKADIKAFIDLYYENMDRVNAVGRYYFTETYFFNIIAQLKAKVDILFAIDKETKQIVSAAMMFKTKDIIHYHISGTKNDTLNLSPIRLLIDEMRIIGTQEGYTYFNLGGGLGNKEDNLFKFKSSFSKDFKPFKIWKHVVNPSVYDELVSAHCNREALTSTDFFPLYRHYS